MIKDAGKNATGSFGCHLTAGTEATQNHAEFVLLIHYRKVAQGAAFRSLLLLQCSFPYKLLDAPFPHNRVPAAPCTFVCAMAVQLFGVLAAPTTIQRIIHTLRLLADNPEGTTGTCVFTCFIEDDGKIPLLLGAFIAGRIGYQDLLV